MGCTDESNSILAIHSHGVMCFGVVLLNTNYIILHEFECTNSTPSDSMRTIRAFCSFWRKIVEISAKLEKICPDFWEYFV